MERALFALVLSLGLTGVLYWGSRVVRDAFEEHAPACADHQR